MKLSLITRLKRLAGCDDTQFRLALHNPVVTMTIIEAQLVGRRHSDELQSAAQAVLARIIDNIDKEHIEWTLSNHHRQLATTTSPRTKRRGETPPIGSTAPTSASATSTSTPPSSSSTRRGGASRGSSVKPASTPASPPLSHDE